MLPTQSVTATANGATSISATLAGVTATNGLVFAVGYNDTSGGAGAPTVPTGTTAVINPAPVAGLPSIGASIFQTANASGGSHTVTMNSLGGGATLFAGASMTEWAFTATPLDQSAGPGTSQGASTTTGSTPATGVLAQSVETVIVALAIGAGTGKSVPPGAGISDPPTGYTSLLALQDTAVSAGVEIAYKDAGSTVAQSATWTWTSDSTQLGSEQSIGTFKQAGASVPLQPFTHTQFFVNDVVNQQ